MCLAHASSSSSFESGPPMWKNCNTREDEPSSSVGTWHPLQGYAQDFVLSASFQEDTDITFGTIHIYDVVTNSHLCIWVGIVPLLCESTCDRPHHQDAFLFSMVHIDADMPLD
mmetsp:Transcript_29819/g.69346  ORF Transcript_29819/g.69346 Transcript_29819/m.69346 type:complete len:113 (+) Transcript_29819:247-585(+)